MNSRMMLRWVVILGAALVLFFIAAEFWRSEKFASATLFAFLTAVSLAVIPYGIRREFMEAEKILSAIRKKDFSLFPGEDSAGGLKQEAIRLYYQSKEENLSVLSFKALYEDILNRQEIGFLILSRPHDRDDWRVFFSNPAFLKILQVPKYNIWNFYREKVPNFFALIDATGYVDSQEFFDYSHYGSSKESYSVRTSRIDSPGNSFCVISMESVQKILDRKEKLAWNNLMKVISHELLNTLTPVNSLIDNLEYLAGQPTVGKEEQEEMVRSLQIMSSKSRQLLHFIDSYRQVAELPKPKKNYFELAAVVRNVLKIFEAELRNNRISSLTRLEEIIIFADEKMVERVLFNLLANAVHAVKEAPEKTVTIETVSVSGRSVVRITDSGPGVGDQIRDKIFLPFFTTRHNGSGIGLTLSKSIMDAHSGYIVQHNIPGGCVFELWFL